MKKNATKATKVITLDGQTVETLNKALKVLKDKSTTSLNADIARGRALAKIKSEELFKVEGSDYSFKEWYNKVHDGTLYGITYKTACILINTYNNVWSDKSLSDMPLAIACRLASVCKTEDGKDAIKALKKAGKISPDMTQRAMNDLLKSEGLMKEKKTESAPAPHSDDKVSEEVLTALSLVGSYLKNNCKDKNILNQWDVILNHCK